MVSILERIAHEIAITASTPNSVSGSSWPTSAMSRTPTTAGPRMRR